jgi:hemin uptake protein HemP
MSTTQSHAVSGTPSQASLHVGTAPHAPSPGRSRARIDSRNLLQGANELLIAHGAEEYRLRLTRNGKLILTK